MTPEEFTSYFPWAVDLDAVHVQAWLTASEVAMNGYGEEAIAVNAALSLLSANPDLFPLREEVDISTEGGGSQKRVVERDELVKQLRLRLRRLINTAPAFSSVLRLQVVP